MEPRCCCLAEDSSASACRIPPRNSRTRTTRPPTAHCEGARPDTDHKAELRSVCVARKNWCHRCCCSPKAQLAVDVTLKFALTRTGEPHPRAADEDGAVLVQARHDKETTCPELIGDAGWWSWRLRPVADGATKRWNSADCWLARRLQMCLRTLGGRPPGVAR